MFDERPARTIVRMLWRLFKIKHRNDTPICSCEKSGPLIPGSGAEDHCEFLTIRWPVTALVGLGKITHVESELFEEHFEKGFHHSGNGDEPTIRTFIHSIAPMPTIDRV